MSLDRATARTFLVALALAALPATAHAADPTRSAPERLHALVRVYLDGLFHAKPHLASYLGIPKYDRLVQDLSPAALARRERDLTAQQRALARVEREELAPEERVDAAVMADGIALELLELREIRPWTWNPRLEETFVHYDPREVVGARLADLIHGSAPEVDRLAAALAQLRALPRTLAQRRAALGTVSRVHLDAAVDELKGLEAFFEGELAAFTGKDPAAERARVAALRAVRDYGRFLATELPPRAKRDWRLGAALYRKKFPHALQTDASPEETERRALEALRVSRAELFRVARKLHGTFWPGEVVPAEDAAAEVQARTINRVRDEIAKVHAPADGLVAATASKLDGLRAFIEREKLVTLPPADTLRVEVMPEFKRGGNGAEYLSPGLAAGAQGWKGTYYVDPPDPSWPPEKIEGYLRTWNDVEIALTAAHEAYPGHHVQAWWSLRDASPLRAALWSGPFAEGWAVYGTTLLVRRGYGGERNDLFRFADLQGALIVAANAVIDVRLQGGTMTDAEALRFMTEESFQEVVQAERKLLRAKLDSTQLCQYFLGAEEIRALEAEARARGGFDQRGFDEVLVGHGTIAVKHLRPFVLGTARPGTAGTSGQAVHGPAASGRTRAK
jgi:uncharacterized protein (DUF885 family)